jgi:hypothetical protein
MKNNRTIRVFLSSTFRDFGEERDLLVKRVFPALRARLRDRFVELVDVDLRWGITVEEAERGEVLPICLAEIDRARPYFIGMLGERYGWIPPVESYAANLLERQPWLKNHQGGKSVTELEILHGVLNNPGMRGRAFFYFRSSKYAKERGGDYLPTASDRQRQKALKEEIRASGLPVTDYTNPEALASRIESDLWQIFDAEFPVESTPDEFERERLRHEAFAASRKGLYLGGDSYLGTLEKLLQGDKGPILIEGSSGAGKSALIANFFDLYREKYPNHLVHEHYLGASADAADPVAVVRRLATFIQRTTGNEIPLSIEGQGPWENLCTWLNVASDWATNRETKFVFVLDSLNSLSDLQDLRWWPKIHPKSICFVVSCLPGPVLEALKATRLKKTENDRFFGWRTIRVRPLQKSQSLALLKAYLGRFNKKLPRAMLSQVRAHPLATNPLFIRTLAEELRLFGIHEELEKRLAHYLGSQSVGELFERVLARVEQDCGSKVVRACLSAIWASRAGLAESDILELAGLTPSAWAAIRYSLEEGLTEVCGKLTYSHDYLFQGVQGRFSLLGNRAVGLHKYLSNFFRAKAGHEAALDLNWHDGQQDVWRSALASLRALKRRKKELAEQAFFRWDGNYLAVLNRAASLRNMLLREPRRHRSAATFFRTGGAQDDYTTYWKFGCCGVEVASEYGRPSRFRDDGCAYVLGNVRGVLFKRLPKSGLPHWDDDDLRTALEAAVLPRAYSKDRLTPAYLRELRRAQHLADHLWESQDWYAMQSLADFYRSRRLIEGQFGSHRAMNESARRMEVALGRLRNTTKT